MSDIKVLISALAVDMNTNSPVIILKEENGERTLPIWIGVAEASAIAIKTANIKTDRPLTHDLMKTLIDAVNAKVIKVVVDDLVENTFYAKIFIQMGNSLLYIDTRPSDAIAIALRCGAPIFVEEKLITPTASQESKESPPRANSADQLRQRLREIDPKDFGNFPLG